MRGSLGLLALSYLGFVSLGLPDSILGAAWPSIRTDLGLRLDAAGPLILLATLGTTISSTFSGRLLSPWSTAVVLVGSTACASLALFGFAFAPSWTFMLAASILAGLGGGAIDAALNGFVARHYDVRHMNWLHGCWGIGATLGPLTLAAMLSADHGWRATYRVLGAIELLLVLAFVFTARHWPRPAPHEAGTSTRVRLTPAMRGRIAFFFLYGGLEAGAGLWSTSFLIEQKGASTSAASTIVGIYWGGLMVGRFVIGALTSRFGAARLVRWSVRAACAATIVLVLPCPLPLAAAAFVAFGLSLAAIYPTVMHETPHEFGDDAARHLVGYQIAAGSLGIATLPWL
ncbi:MAG TPA: MFS transporter, partial [Polyangia bacterium]